MSDDNKKTSHFNKNCRIWNQEQNVLPEGMVEKIYLKKRVMKDSLDLLNEEVKYNNKDRILQLRKKNEFKRSSSSKIIEDVSPYSKTILLKIGGYMRKIKQSISDITKMNGLYLEDKSKLINKYQNKNSTLSPVNFHRNKLNIDKANKTNSFTMKNLKKKAKSKSDLSEKDDDGFYGGRSKKDDYLKNFLYVNDNYRKQLNCAFLKYNPISHLENLKILAQADPILCQDINNVKKEVDDSIKQITKKVYRKKNIEILEKQSRSRSVQQNESNKSNNNLKKQGKLPKISDNNNKIEKKKSLAQIPQNTNQNFIFSQKNRKNYYIKQLNALKEMQKDEYKQMLLATSKINDFINERNIKDKIDLFKTDYAKNMYSFNRNYDDDDTKNSNNMNLMKKDYYANDKKNVVKEIGNVYCFKMQRTVREGERAYREKISSAKKKFDDKIIDGKEKTNKELTSYLEKNRINME